MKITESPRTTLKTCSVRPVEDTDCTATAFLLLPTTDPDSAIFKIASNSRTALGQNSDILRVACPQLWADMDKAWSFDK